MMNAAADAWGQAQHEGREIARTLVVDEYWYRWDDYAAGDEPGEMLHAEVRKALRDRGLTLESTDSGMLVTEIDDPDAEAAEVGVESYDPEEIDDDAAIVIGDHVESGDNAEDYDHGEVVEIRGDEARVAWRQSLTTTWTTLESLRPYGERTL